MRNKDGTFATGNNISNGRPKGSRNKQTNEIREFFSDFISRHMAELDQAFDVLEAKDKFKFLMDMAKFVIPNLKAIEFGNVLDELTEDDFERLITKLKDEYQLN